MHGNTNHDVLCSAALEIAEQQASKSSADFRSVRGEDPSLARLRQSLDQLPDTVSWEEMRSRILAALSDLPDERRPCPALARHLPSAFHGGCRDRSAPHEPTRREKQCLEPKSRQSAQSSASRLPHLLRARRVQFVIWALCAVVLVIAIPLVLRRSNATNIPPHILPARQRSSAALSRAPEVRPAQARVVAPVAAKAATITAVEPEFTPGSARVAIALTAPVEYEVHRLARPERVYIDFHNAGLAPQTKAGSFIIGTPCLLKYRLAARAPLTVRIAFETDKACDYSTRLTSAPSPRLVLVLRPAPSTTAP